MIIIKILVQMPDGSFQKLPMVGMQNEVQQVIKKPTRKEARDWAQVIMPERITLEEEQ